MLKKFGDLATGSLGLLFIALYILFGLGELYWLWMAFKIGSFWMFVFGFIPPTLFIAALVGAYALIFEMPSWVYTLFG